MRTVFLIDRDDLATLKSGQPWEVQVGNGQSITFQMPGKTKASGSSENGSNGHTATGAERQRKAYDSTFKRKILTEIRHKKKQGTGTYYSVAKAHALSPSMVLRWTKVGA